MRDLLWQSRSQPYVSSSNGTVAHVMVYLTLAAFTLMYSYNTCLHHQTTRSIFVFGWFVN